MTLDELVQQVPEFERWGPTEQIRFIAWYFHVHEARSDIDVGDLRRAFRELNMTVPSGLSQLVKQLVDKGDLDRRGDRLVLVRNIRNVFDGKYGQRRAAIAISQLLRQLPEQVPAVAEKDFLGEAIKCFEAGAFRAAIVMTWNLAYDHFLDWVVRNHAANFNAQWPITFPRGAQLKITKREDFADAKEFQVLQVSRMAGIITEDIRKMLEEKLNKRNSAAHPSDLTFGQAETEAFIEHLVQNVVLKFA